MEKEFKKWCEVTGIITPGTSYYYEMLDFINHQNCIEREKVEGLICELTEEKNKLAAWELLRFDDLTSKIDILKKLLGE